jgi:hypothetical protein
MVHPLPAPTMWNTPADEPTREATMTERSKKERWALLAIVLDAPISLSSFIDPLN